MTRSRAADRAPRVLLAAVGDANAECTWSGTPHHIVMHGRALGVVDAGLALETTAPDWRRRRFVWNAVRLMTHLEHGGYQFSESFVERLWRSVALRPDDTLINVFPLYPSRLFARHSGQKWFFIDQTLNQAFDFYALPVGPRMAADAMARERAQFRAAAGVIAQSAWAARDVVETYGVPPEKVHIAIAGANIDRGVLAAWETGRTFEERSAERPLRLVFVGKEWRRKGLDRLLRALALARTEGAAVELVVIGVDPAFLPDELARTDGVVWAGFIDKRRELPRFLNTVADCDVGCLLSCAEAGGISLREFVRLGLATLAPAVGGAPEYVVEGASDLVGADASDAEIATIVTRLAGDRDDLSLRRRIAWERRHEASWDVPVRAIGRLIGRDPGCEQGSAA